MSDEPFSFDFSDIQLPPAAQRAVEEVGRDDLLTLFQKLAAANARWDDPTQGQRGAALAALEAVVGFVGGQGYDLTGGFSRPLALLLQELRSAPAPAPGSILPPLTRGQAIEATRRKAVNRLKAAGTYAARRIGTPEYTLKRACNDVAAIFIAHRFPTADYFRADGEAKTGPERATVAARLEEWCSDYKTAENEPGEVFRALCSLSPPFIIDPADTRDAILRWLRDALEAGGYSPV